jgi:hypothetical protein
MLFPAEIENVVRVSLGWLIRLVRTAQAVGRLYENGYSGESPPLVRSCMQHAAAIAWLSKNRDSAVGAVVAESKSQQRKLLKDVHEAAWDVNVSDISLLDSMNDKSGVVVGMPDFKQLCRDIAFPQLYITYRVESALTHPTYLSGAAYWHGDGEGGEGSAFHLDTKSPRVHLVWVIAMMMLGASSFDDLSPDEDFGRALSQIDVDLGLNLLKIEPKTEPTLG